MICIQLIVLALAGTLNCDTFSLNGDPLIKAKHRKTNQKGDDEHSSGQPLSIHFLGVTTCCAKEIQLNNKMTKLDYATTQIVGKVRTYNRLCRRSSI